MKSSSTQIIADIWQNELLTVKEVATYLRVSRVTVWRWCQQGTLPASRLGHNWRIRREDLLRLLENSKCPDSDTIDSTPPLEADGST